MQDVNLDVDATLSVLTQLIVIIGGIAAGFYALKRWIKRTAIDPLTNQVMPNGGRPETTRHVVEEIADNANTIVTRLDELEEGREENRKMIEQAMDTANQALTISTHTSERLDKYMERGING